MQAIIGTVLFVLIAIVSLIYATYLTRRYDNWVGRILVTALYFAAIVTVVYIALGLVLGFFWVWAWLGTLLRDVVMWLAEAVLTPWKWVVH